MKAGELYMLENIHIQIQHQNYPSKHTEINTLDGEKNLQKSKFHIKCA